MRYINLHLHYITLQEVCSQSELSSLFTLRAFLCVLLLASPRRYICRTAQLAAVASNH